MLSTLKCLSVSLVPPNDTYEEKEQAGDSTQDRVEPRMLIYQTNKMLLSLYGGHVEGPALQSPFLQHLCLYPSTENIPFSTGPLLGQQVLAKPVGNERTVEEGLFTLPTCLSYQGGNSPSPGSNWMSYGLSAPQRKYHLGQQGGNNVICVLRKGATCHKPKRRSRTTAAPLICKELILRHPTSCGCLTP